MIPQATHGQVAAVLAKLESCPTVARMDRRWRRYLAEEAIACVRIARSMKERFPTHRIDVERRATHMLRHDRTLLEIPDEEISAAIRAAMEAT